MKKFMLSIFVTGAIAAYSQKVDATVNRFAAAENTASTVVASNEPGNPPGDKDLPIDGYIPLLAISAVAIIIGYKKREKLHN